MSFPLPTRFAAVSAAALLGLTGVVAGAAPAQARTQPDPARSRTASAVPAACTVAGLRLSMGSQDVGAGQLYWPIRFTNTGSHSCSLRGYPGVTVLNAKHGRIGTPATHSGRSYDTVTVRPGRTVTAIVHTTNGPLGGPCRATGSYLRVYPPGSLRALTVPAKFRVCSNTFDISPVMVPRS
ncbi:DUF4232 domain-containing protein [Peterkaempfera bronchialis]|uniref:DUF4232 domain-containing protein n=1 Tax=Peterkaempfera bronchialis TaxID=2126346 RepID=A0A345T4B9_9ACTN|nr:DUF4232 domain-containing protein [Peterkaempfera bronchialis]AXI80824.1 DUF4232 domain-containing protein [Peterkaempfera bronchialis]